MAVRWGPRGEGLALGGLREPRKDVRIFQGDTELTITLLVGEGGTAPSVAAPGVVRGPCAHRRELRPLRKAETGVFS